MIKIITNLEKKMEKIQGSINYNLEELNNKHTNNTITEIKNNWEDLEGAGGEGGGRGDRDGEHM